jgi:HEAT repeat protein
MRYNFARIAILAVVLAGAALPAAMAAPAGQQIAFEEVLAKLRATEPAARIDALNLLAQAGYLEGAPPALSLLRDPVPEVQVAAMDTLLSLYLADEDYTRKFGADVISQKGASLPLLAFAQGGGQLVPNTYPPDLIRGLVACLNSSVTSVRFNAAYTLGVFGPYAARKGAFPDGRAAVDALTAMARDSDPLIRLAATQVLGRLYDAAFKNESGNADLMGRRIDAGDQVISGINDADSFVKHACIKAVGEMRLDRGIQSLIDYASYYKSGGVAQQAYESLGRIGHASALPALFEALGSRDERIRATAVAGIGRIGDKRSIYDMETRVTKDRSQAVKLALAFSRVRNGDLSQIAVLVEGFKKDALAASTFDYLLDLGSSVAGALAPVATHSDMKVRAGVAEVLGSIGNEQSVFVVQSLSRDKTRLVSGAGLRSVKRLSPRPPNAPRLM